MDEEGFLAANACPDRLKNQERPLTDPPRSYQSTVRADAKKSAKKSTSKKRKEQRSRHIQRLIANGTYNMEKAEYCRKQKEERATAGRARTDGRVSGIFQSTLVVHFEGRSGSSDIWKDGYKNSMTQYDRYGFRLPQSATFPHAEPAKEQEEDRPNTPVLIDYEDPGSWAD